MALEKLGEKIAKDIGFSSREPDFTQLKPTQIGNSLFGEQIQVYNNKEKILSKCRQIFKDFEFKGKILG